ncbi:hypothetical protein K2173_025250 [Erythroxylum novogranatense]|uniref:CCHC-type domain-containing protein n=1 Tax=Erythroxylum novogranatense TaxID=1862640 RepID=A0AAV8UHB8_9ROSI|nr:hypothetical protein K2173_025250 [Erythroxylum novogranatense]
MPKWEVDGDGNRVICKLSNKRTVTVQKFKGKSYVSIREFYLKGGKQFSSHKGINLPTEQWSTLNNSIPAIEEAISKIQSKLRSENDSEQTEHTTNPVLTPDSQELLTVKVSRFDGRNYQSWAAQMELFLGQLKLRYVLTEPRPSIAVNQEANNYSQAKVVECKWFNDNLMCCHHILSSLSDSLYLKYSKKAKNAKELWEELKLVYQYEDFGNKLSQVKKYIEFQMVDDKPILQQVQELNGIADSIVSTGTSIDDSFHVHVVISKLPPSWRDFCTQVMRDEYIPFWVLMEHIRVEEEARNLDTQRQPSNSVCYYTNNIGPRMKDMNRPGLHWKRRETENHYNAPVCNFCGKKGHISRHCRNKKFDTEAGDKADNETSHRVAGVNMLYRAE